MILTAEILVVDPVKEDPWTGGQQPLWFVQGRFKDAGIFSRGCASLDRAKELKTLLEGLRGPGQFEVEEKGEYNGSKKYALKSWPGKPERPAFGGKGPGGGGFVPRFRDTEEGFLREQRSIHRSVALEHAVAFQRTIDLAKLSNGGVLATAEEFHQWLSKDTPTMQRQPPEANASGTAAPAQEISSAPQQRSQPVPAARAPKPPCPSCGKAEFVLQARDDDGKDKPGEYFCWKNASRGKLGCGHKWVDAKQLAASSGMTTGDTIQTAKEKYITEIQKAVLAKDGTRLSKLAEMIVQSVEASTVTLDEAEDLDRRLAAARKSLTSATSHDEWYEKKQEEAQMSLDEMTNRF